MLLVEVRLEESVAVPERVLVVVRDAVVVADSVRLDVADLLFVMVPVEVLELVVVLDTEGEPLEVLV